MQNTFAAGAGSLLFSSFVRNNRAMNIMKPIKITGVNSNFEREPLLFPFGFKGGYLTELWQNISCICTANNCGLGLATQSVLYCDPDTFLANSESGGNGLMFVFSNEALAHLRGSEFTTPFEKTESLFLKLKQYARNINPVQPVSDVFILNALVSVDNALWQLYYKENRFNNFTEMLPAENRAALSYRNNKIGILFQVSYNMPLEEIVRNVDEGYFIIKIKAGQPGDPEEMLEKDKKRIKEIADALKDKRTRHTANQKVLYTIDANGRYPSVALLKRLIAYIKQLGVLDQFIFLEEPLPISNKEFVGDLGVPIGADESAMDLQSVEERIRQGYKVIVLKPMAKTLSRSIQIASLAHKHNIPCVCSDLTVNPILVDWQKNLIARVKPFPQLNMALMETNGNENYKNWEVMRTYLKDPHASWEAVKEGVIDLPGSFWETNGNIFETPGHYSYLIPSKK